MTDLFGKKALVVGASRGMGRGIALAFSSGAALNGSPVSGSYAGAKATLRFIADYAGQEARRAGLGISVTAILPRLTAETDLGRPAVAAYAARAGITEAQFVSQMGTPVTAAVAGAAFVQLATTDPARLATAYTLTGDRLQPPARTSTPGLGDYGA